MAHGAWIFTTIKIILITCHRSSAEIGNLLDKDVKTSFQPHNAQWSLLDSRYYVCNSEGWLKSKKVLNTTGIKELYIKVVYVYRKNTLKSRLNNSAFHLGALDASIKTPVNFSMVNGTWNNESYISTTSLLINSKALRIWIAPEKNFGDSCMFVSSVEITYKYCKQKERLSFAKLPQTFAPPHGAAAIRVQGHCMYSSHKAVAFCSSSGFWLNATFPCDCAPGKVMISDRCTVTSFVSELQVVRLSNTKARLSWKKGLPGNIIYNIVCYQCFGKHCNKKCPPGVKVINNTMNKPSKNGSVIKGLKAGVEYKFTILAKLNDVKRVNWNETPSSVILQALPQKVKNLRLTLLKERSIKLTWIPGGKAHDQIVVYDIGCKMLCETEFCAPDQCKHLKFAPASKNVRQTNVIISGFNEHDLQYIFEVRTKNNSLKYSEWYEDIIWNYVAINYTADFKEPILLDSKSVSIVDIIIGVSVFLLTLVVAIFVARFYNRWRRGKEAPGFDDENHEYLTATEISLTDITAHYVNPTDYDRVENVLRKFTIQLNEKNLKTEVIIGEGEFGVVWKGFLKKNRNVTTVAVKCLRSGLSPKNRHDFLAEASVMGQFKHPNIISLYGVIVKKQTVKIVMEYMTNGSLNHYLVENNGKLIFLQLLGMARGIASGMNYLSGRNFIHRDLAARNILVDEQMICKVSDFGLTREICRTSNYETRGGKIPIRWTAPEVIKHRKSFKASDVWSYGVVLWEIMAYGQRPYWEWDNFRVLQELENGYRLPAPLKCPKSVHILMLDCWEKERTSRPTFLQIIERLDDWIRSPETVHYSPEIKLRKNIKEIQSPISDWLDSIKMGKYTVNFHDAGYDRLSQIMNLTEQDLTEMGITLIGHRHKIHQSIPLVT